MASEKSVRGGGPSAGRDKRRSAAAKPRSNGRPAAGRKTQAASESPPPDSGDLVVVTMQANTGSIVSVEIATPDGSRHPLTDRETERLVGERPTFATLVHDAFEAGIACILDEGGADEGAGETEEDADLHDALLDALIEHSAAKRLLRRETLQSAALSTIIHSASGGDNTGSARASGGAA